MASIFLSAMSFCARAMRARRSSAVIGFARLRIDVSAAMLAGRGPAAPLPSAPRPRCAESRTAGRPTVAPAIERNERREIIDNSSMCSGHFTSAARPRGSIKERYDAPAHRALVPCVLVPEAPPHGSLLERDRDHEIDRRQHRECQAVARQMPGAEDGHDPPEEERMTHPSIRSVDLQCVRLTRWMNARKPQ